MLSHGWQIGLHITSNSVSVIAIHYQRRSWVLQRWWFFSLRHPPFTAAGSMGDVSQLKKILASLRAHLPRKYSLRVSYPAQCVIFRVLPLPARSLTPYHIERYVALSIERLFPNLSVNELSWDYRPGPNVSKELSVTVTRAKMLNSYCALFHSVGLTLDVVELGSSSLQPLISRSLNCCLITEDAEHWFWAAHNGSLWHHGWFLRRDYPHAASLPAAITTQYQHYFLSGSQAKDVAAPLRPFSALGLRSGCFLPLPPVPYLFTVALGLALREKDQS